MNNHTKSSFSAHSTFSKVHTCTPWHIIVTEPLGAVPFSDTPGSFPTGNEVQLWIGTVNSSFLLLSGSIFYNSILIKIYTTGSIPFSPNKKWWLLGVPLWCSGLRIGHCHCSGSGLCCGSGLIPGPGTSTCPGRHRQKKKKRSPTQMHARTS